MKRLMKKKSQSPSTSRDNSDFRSILNETEVLTELEEKLDLFINAAVNEANEVNTRKIMYSHFKIKKHSEINRVIDKISKIKNKNENKRNRTMIYQTSHTTPNNKYDADIKEEIRDARGVTIINPKPSFNKSLERLGVGNDVSILLNHNEKRSDMDIFDAYLHEKTHESKELKSKDYWYDSRIISHPTKKINQALFEISNGTFKDLSTIVGNDKPKKSLFTSQKNYAKASRKNADTLKSAIKTLAYSTSNPKIIKFGTQNGSPTHSYDVSDSESDTESYEESNDPYYNLAQKIIEPKGGNDNSSDEAVFNYIFREFGLIMLNHILRKHGNDATVRLKDGELKFGKGRNALKNILFGSRYKQEREAAAMHFLGKSEGRGKEISVSEAIAMYDKDKLISNQAYIDMKYKKRF